MKRDVGAAGKQAQHFFRVEQSVSFEELVVQLPVRSNNVARQGSCGLAVRSNGDSAQGKKHRQNHQGGLPQTPSQVLASLE
jgi:hypothetical protein